MIPAGAIRKRAIIRQFLEAGAVSEETARTPEEAGVFQGLGIKSLSVQIAPLTVIG